MIRDVATLVMSTDHILEEVQRLKTYLDSVRSVLTMLRLSPKEFEFTLRADVPIVVE